MTRRLQLALLLLAAALAGAETVDRIVVVVNKGIILASQWDQAVRFEAFAEGTDLRNLTAAAREQTLDRLIDQELLEQEMAQSTYKNASAEEIAAKVAELRRQLAPDASDAQWHEQLARYGLDEQDVRERVAVQLDELRFIDLRFRPTIHIDSRNVTSYYRNTLIPQLERRGEQPPSLADARPQIEEILVQQRIDDLLSAYLKNLRAQARIQRMDEAKEPR
ncbi:MAG TPA: hypothetical protein VL382_01520 [Terriglobales bacterium]|nr:hypothetical protein [Terriglobales bacterium]